MKGKWRADVASWLLGDRCPCSKSKCPISMKFSATDQSINPDF